MVAAILLLLTSLLLLVQLPVVQTFISQKVADFLSVELQTKVSVGSVDIDFFNSLVLNDFYIEDRRNDTLIHAKSLRADISLINFKGRKLYVSELKLNNAHVELVIFEGDTSNSMQFLLGYFQRKDSSSSDQQKWLLDFNTLSLDSSSFSYHNHNFPKDTIGIDFNHIELENIEGSFLNTIILEDTIQTEIQQLAFDEGSGFSVGEMGANAFFSPEQIRFKDLDILTDKTTINADLVFRMQDYSAFNDFVDEVSIQADFSKSSLHTGDLAYFATDLIGLDFPVELQGKVYGKIADLSADDLYLKVFGNTTFRGDLDIRGLPEYEQTTIHLDVEQLSTNATDLQLIPLPPFDGNMQLRIPDGIFKLGQIEFQGKLTGFFNDMVAYGDFETLLGNFSTDISLKKNSTQPLSYSGQLIAHGFDVGEFLDIDKMGSIKFKAKVQGRGMERENLQLEIDGFVNSLVYNEYKYKNIDLSGNIANNKFLGDLKVRDENLTMDFSGKIDASGRKPIMDFQAKIAQAQLANLNIFHKKDSLTSLSMDVQINLEGMKLDELEGMVNLNNIHYVDAKRDYLYEQIKLSSEQNGKLRRIILLSDLIDLELNGEYQLVDLEESLKELANKYIPSVQYVIGDSVENNFDFKLKFKDTEAITSLFLPSLSLANGGNLQGSFQSTGNRLQLDGYFDYVNFASLDFKKVEIEGKNDADSLELEFDINRVMLGDSSILQDVQMDFATFFNTMTAHIMWDNQSVKLNRAEINIEAAFNGFENFSMVIHDSYIAFADSIWNINESNEIQVFEDRVKFHNFNMASGSQRISISGELAKDSTAELLAEMQNIDLDYLTTVVPKDIAQLEGLMNGEIHLRNYYSSPLADLHFNFSDLVVNNVPIGQSELKSFWDSESRSMDISANVGSVDSNLLLVQGVLYPYAKTENLDLKLMVDSFPISILSPYINDYLSNISGSISGLLNVGGNYKEPVLSGEFDLDSAQFTVNYLNTSYIINDDFFVEEDLIGFNLINVVDKSGNKAIATGTVFHDNYTDFNLDIGLEMNNFLALNTGSSDNDLYFGKAVVSGLGNITGFADQLIFDINITTEKGTNFNIPLDRGLEVSSSDFLTFKNSDTLTAELDNYQVDLTGIQLNFDLQVTPDAQVSMIFDEKIGDVIKANGAGNLKLEINTLGDFNMYGQYVVEQGEYLFTLQNVINKKFEIEKGGRISWNGNPYDAIIDIDAVYSLRASLYDILVDTLGSYKRRIPVDLTLMMSGDLMNPDIDFDIEVPTADDRARQALESILYLNPSQINRQEMNQQVFGLLVLNRFLPPTGAGQVNEDYQRTSLGAQSSSEFLSNQLSNWLSTISEDVDIGIRYRPGDELSSDEVELELSTEILSDRVILDGNFGYSNNEYNIRNQNNSGLIGEFSIEYKISKDGRLRVRGFNRSNNNSLLYTNSPYTQGFGIFYREEFNHLGELWRKWLSKDSGKKEEESNFIAE